MRSDWPSTRGSRTTTRHPRPMEWTWRGCVTRTDSGSPTGCDAFITVDDGSDRRLWLRGRRADGNDAGAPRRGQAPFPGSPATRHPTRARAGGRMGAVRPDVRRPHRRPGAPSGPPPAVRAVAGAAGMDDALTDPARGRALGARAHRRQPLPPPLGVRRRQQALAQVGPDGLQGLVPQVVRQAQPVGRRGLRGARVRRGVCLGDLIVGAVDARRRQTPYRALSRWDSPLRAGRARNRGTSHPRRRSSASSAAASVWPSTARALSSGSGRTSKVVFALRATSR